MSTHRAPSLRVRAAATAAPLLLAACVVGPNYHSPALPAASSYGVETGSPAPTSAAGGADSRLVSGLDISAAWWGVFHSADLDALVAQALKNNPTLEAAKAALRAAREQLKAQRGADFPSVGLSLQPSRQSFARTLASPLQSNASLYDLTTTQVSVSYAPDLFGANARAVESLVAQQDQQRFELEAARLTLASNVVLAAIQDALSREQVEDTRAIIVDQQLTLSSFQRQYQLGQVSKADLAARETVLAQTQATLPPLIKAFEVNRDLLSALVGRTPGEPLAVQFAFRSLSPPEQLPLSLPAQLIQHRPDVRIAEAQLRAASAQVGVATAARFPNLAIDANAGGAALGLAPAFSGAANFWSVAATLTQPVFQGGALLHRERAAKAAYDQAAAEYRGTVVGAFQNTADVLHALRADADAERAAEIARSASARSLNIARQRLVLGDISPLAVLDAEQSEAQARLALLQARADRYADAVALFQALGGGWWNDAAAASRATPGLSRP